jgi:hypothetical protein
MHEQLIGWGKRKQPGELSLIVLASGWLKLELPAEPTCPPCRSAAREAKEKPERKMIHWVKHWGLAKSKYFAKFATYALAVLAEA